MPAESGSGFEAGYRGSGRGDNGWASSLSARCVYSDCHTAWEDAAIQDIDWEETGRIGLALMSDDGLALSQIQKSWLRLNRVLWTTLCDGRIRERLQWKSPTASLCFYGAETSWSSSLALESGTDMLSTQKLAVVRVVCWKESKFWVPVTHHVLWNTIIPFVSFARF